MNNHPTHLKLHAKHFIKNLSSHILSCHQYNIGDIIIEEFHKKTDKASTEG